MEVVLEVIMYSSGDVDIAITSHHHFSLAGREFKEIFICSDPFGHEMAGCPLLQAFQQAVHWIGCHPKRKQQQPAT